MQLIILRKIKYEFSSDTIFLSDDRRLDRKTLKYYGTFLSGKFKEIGSCEVYLNKKELNKEKKKLIRKRQIEYNKELEGNKI